MAMIKCPECGKDVSDRATSCPNCGYPISKMASFGRIMIKLGAQSNGFNSKQKVTISDQNGRILWEGYSGTIAELSITKVTNISIKYHTSWSANLFGGTTSGTIDPNKWSKYNVSAKVGAFGKIAISFHGSDVIDSD